MNFDENLNRYAELLVEYGLNVQPGEFVQIAWEPGAQELARLAAIHAYRRGARHVFVAYSDPHVIHAQLTIGPSDERFFFPMWEKMRNEQIVDVQGCYLDIRTDSEPDLFNEIPDLVVARRRAYVTMRDRFYSEGIEKGMVSWCVAYASSPKPAQKVYPDLSLEDAHKAYWDAIFRMTFADKPDCLERWKKFDRTLQARKDRLTALGIQSLHYRGPGTELVVELRREAVWQGGTKKHAVKEKRFEANIPSFEVFTTPDRTKTRGTVRITRPVMVEGIFVEDLQLSFENGKIVDGNAKRNWNVYEKYINSDEGARYLGEVALVGLDSPVASESPLLREILFTENGACHIATGSGYASGLKNGWNLSKEQLAALGRNDSKTHLDIMISDKDVDVAAVTYDGNEITLIRSGHWVKEFS